MNKKVFNGLIRFSLAAFLLTAAAPSLAGSKLDLSAGRMSLSGTASIGSHNILNTQRTFSYGAAVGYSYFVMKNLSVGGVIGVVNTKQFDMPDQGMLGLGVAYYFNASDMIKPYLGLRVDVQYAKTATDSVDSGFGVSAGLPVGILIGLSDSVALDLGLRIHSTIPSWKVGIDGGMIGVRAFF